MTQTGDWLAVGAIAVSLATLARGYLRNPVLAPIRRVDALERQVRDLIRENKVCMDRNAVLEREVERLQSNVGDLRRQIMFWQDEFRKLREEK